MTWSHFAPRRQNLEIGEIERESLTCARTVPGLGTVAQKQIAADVVFTPARPEPRPWERWWAAAWLAFPPHPRGRVQGSGKEAALHVAGKRRCGVCQIDANQIVLYLTNYMPSMLPTVTFVNEQLESALANSARTTATCCGVGSQVAVAFAPPTPSSPVGSGRRARMRGIAVE